MGDLDRPDYSMPEGVGALTISTSMMFEFAFIWRRA
jgi:hypothetical protein